MSFEQPETPSPKGVVQTQKAGNLSDLEVSNKGEVFKSQENNSLSLDPNISQIEDIRKIDEVRQKLGVESIEKDLTKKEERIISDEEVEQTFVELRLENSLLIGVYNALMKSGLGVNPDYREKEFAYSGGYSPDYMKSFLKKYPTRADFETFWKIKSPIADRKQYQVSESDVEKVLDTLYKESPEDFGNLSGPDNPEKPKLPNNPLNCEFVKDSELISKSIDPRQQGKIYQYPQSLESNLIRWYGHYPEIGAKYLRTAQGQINGILIWSDGETAIFETPQGKIKMRFKSIVSPSGKTYGEIEHDRRRSPVKLKERNLY